MLEDLERSEEDKGVVLLDLLLVFEVASSSEAVKSSMELALIRLRSSVSLA